MQKIKILIVEDEPIISQFIGKCVEYYGHEIMAKCFTVQDAVSICKIRQPDIAILDINLGDKLDGIDLALILKKQYNFPIIFLTSYSDEKFIERAKQAKPSAYLVKPIVKEALNAAISIALDNYSKNEAAESLADQNNLNKEENPICSINQSIFVKDKGQFIKISHSDILWIEANDTYCFLQTKSKKYLVSQSMKKIESKLDQEKFLRVHRSYIINLNQIQSLDTDFLTIGTKKISIGKSFKPLLFDKLNLL